MTLETLTVWLSVPQSFLWALTLAFGSLLFFAVACKLMRFTASEHYDRGKQDATPLRARNGQFIGRNE